MLRPAVFMGIMVAAIGSCGETPSSIVAKHSRSPFLSPSDEPSLMTLAYELDIPVEPERKTVQCDLIPPTERAHTPECAPPEPATRRPRPPREPYPELEPVVLEELWPELAPFEEPMFVEPQPITRYRVPGREIEPEVVPVPIPRPELSPFSQAALGIGAAGFGAAAMGLAVGGDDPTSGTMIFSGTMLALGFAALAVGGIVALVEEGEAEEIAAGEAKIVVTPLGVRGSF